MERDRLKIKSIAVLGMHRSGTSCVAGMISELGFYLGKKERMIPSDNYNMYGYFEDQLVVDCNEAILDQLITSNPHWNNVGQYGFSGSLNLGWLLGSWVDQYECDSDFSSLIEPVLGIIKDEIEVENPWIIKDPRLALNLGIWSDFINVVGLVHVVRHPRKVIYSLCRRDGISPTIAADVYCIYNYMILEYLQKYRGVTIDFDKLLIDKGEQSKLIEFFEDKNRISSDSEIENFFNFVNPNLESNIPNDFNYVCDSELMKLYEQFVSSGCPEDEDGYYSKSNIYKRSISALYECEKITLRERNNFLIQKLKRVNNHPIAGFILSALRTLKRDKGFGSID